MCVPSRWQLLSIWQTLEKSELDRLQGVEMYLPQGNYTVVLWANASDAQTKLGGFPKEKP